IQARTPGKMERLIRWSRRNPTLVGALATIVLLMLVLSIGSVLAAFSFAEKRAAALKNLDRAEQADRDLKEQLARSYLDEARAKRGTNQAGRRFHSLEKIDQALQLFQSLDIADVHRNELRDETIASLASADFRLAKKWEHRWPLYSSAALDPSF